MQAGVEATGTSTLNVRSFTGTKKSREAVNVEFVLLMQNTSNVIGSTHSAVIYCLEEVVRLTFDNRNLRG